MDYEKMFGEVEWKKPPTFRNNVGDFTEQVFEHLDSASFGGREEMEEVLKDEIVAIKERFDTPKNDEEIGFALKQIFYSEGDPEKTKEEKKASVDRAASQLIDLLELQPRKDNQN